MTRMILVVVTLSVAVACVAPGVPGEPASVDEPIAAAVPVDISTRVPASGALEFIVRPGPVVVLGGEPFPLSELERFSTGDDKPLADRAAILAPTEGVTYAEVIQVVDALLGGHCTDIVFRGVALSDA